MSVPQPEAIAAGAFPNKSRRAATFGRVPSGQLPRIGEFNHELER